MCTCVRACVCICVYIRVASFILNKHASGEKYDFSYRIKRKTLRGKYLSTPCIRTLFICILVCEIHFLVYISIHGQNQELKSSEGQL